MPRALPSACDPLPLRRPLWGWQRLQSPHGVQLRQGAAPAGGGWGKVLAQGLPPAGGRGAPDQVSAPGPCSAGPPTSVTVPETPACRGTDDGDGTRAVAWTGGRASWDTCRETARDTRETEPARAGTQTRMGPKRGAVGRPGRGDDRGRSWRDRRPGRGGRPVALPGLGCGGLLKLGVWVQ